MARKSLKLSAVLNSALKHANDMKRFELIRLAFQVRMRQLLEAVPSE